jgi:hypothetical protein
MLCYSTPNAHSSLSNFIRLHCRRILFSNGEWVYLFKHMAIISSNLSRAITGIIAGADFTAGLDFLAYVVDVPTGSEMHIENIDFVPRSDPTLVTFISVKIFEDTRLVPNIALDVQLGQTTNNPISSRLVYETDELNIPTGEQAVISRQYANPLVFEGGKIYSIVARLEVSAPPAGLSQLIFSVFGRIVKPDSATPKFNYAFR